jgi:hypothetical protein
MIKVPSNRAKAIANIEKALGDSATTGVAACRNPSFGLATKAKGLQGCGPRESPGITSHTLGSVGKYEGMNPHTPKATPTLRDGVSVDSQNFIE